MGYAMWCFLQTADLKFVRYPLTQYESFFRRRSPVNRSVESPARFVEVHVELQGRRPVAFGRLHCRQYQLDEAGFIDAGHQQEVESHFHTVVGDVLELRDRSNVYEIAPRVAGRELHKIHFWVPTRPQLNVIVEAINSRAGSSVISNAIAERLIFRRRTKRGA